MFTYKNKWPGWEGAWVDLNQFSCLNGWTSGNLIASAHDVSQFFYEVLATEHILSKESQEAMKDFETSVYGGDPRGLGLVKMPLKFGLDEPLSIIGQGR